MAHAKQHEIDEKLVQLRREGEEREARRRAEALGLSYVDPVSVPVELDAIRLVEESVARSAHLAVVEKKGKSLVVIAENPQDDAAQEIIERLKKDGHEVRLFVSSASGLLHVWKSYEHIAKAAEKITDEIIISHEAVAKLEGDLRTIEGARRALSDFDANAPSVSDSLARIFVGAIMLRASDIHFEPGANAVRLRYRIDGVLHDISSTIPLDAFSPLLSRIKLVSRLKLNVTREPQDGRFTIRYGTRDIDVRVSSIPSEYGETVVMRLLDSGVASLALEDIGLREDDLEVVERELRKPNGMILTTGPTGSGKTTTLYAFLRHTQSSETKTITIEDPIEYRLEGIEQTQVDSDAGYTFGNGLRSLMRQDPDIILVGEIRDAETAGIAIQAALTGHLVFSTVHANESVGAITRLADLDVLRPSIASALNLIIAQRLVRRLCVACREPQDIPAELKSKIDGFIDKLPQRISREPYRNPTLFSARGCPQCQQNGYHGRVGVYELFQVTEAVQGIVEAGAAERELVRHLRDQQKMIFLQSDGVLKALTGVTTLEEVERVAGIIDWNGGTVRAETEIVDGGASPP